MHVSGQGYIPPSSPKFGANSKQGGAQSTSTYLAAKKFMNRWQGLGRAECRNSGARAALCAPAVGDTYEQLTALLLATSPPAYSSTNTADTGGVRVIAPAENQGECTTCTSLAVVAAAQAAVASVLQRDVENVLLSAQVRQAGNEAYMECMAASKESCCCVLGDAHECVSICHTPHHWACIAPCRKKHSMLPVARPQQELQAAETVVQHLGDHALYCASNPEQCRC